MNLTRLYHTIKHLKPIQIKYQIRYRLHPVRKELKFLSESTEAPSTKKLNFTPWIEKQGSFTKDCTFEFLNKKKIFENDKIDWQEESYGKLWTYNLNYMDYLLQSDMSKETGLYLIKDFIRNLSFNKIGIEPYPISLRGINWIKFLSKYNIVDDEINQSLWFQYNILAKRPEYHLLGNHLLENGFSLLFGAFYFGSKKFYDQAKKILVAELKEQILDDGGHFELSPMYHQIILDRLLDTINLLGNNYLFNDQNEIFFLLKKKAVKMLQWLDQMTFANGDIPYFNDAAPGIAPTSKQLFNYADKILNLSWQDQNIKLNSSGYRRFNGENYECIIDVGKLGPDYIPGHAHADMFNFVLYVHDKPVIVDTGISTYDKNERRCFERSTLAHNTVVVDDRNQSDVWGGFRVGKRAKINILLEENNQWVAVHDGYNPVIHKRRFLFEKNFIRISDKVTSGKKVKALLYFHNDISVEYIENEIKSELFTLSFENAGKVKIEYFFLPDGYNRYQKATKAIIEFSDQLITRIVINE